MDKSNNKLDYFDKGIDLYDFYVEVQRRSIANEIIWIDRNKENVEKMRVYLSRFLNEKRISQLSDDDIKKLIEIRANCLYSQFQNSYAKIDTKRLKLIVKLLKSQGY